MSDSRDDTGAARLRPRGSCRRSAFADRAADPAMRWPPPLQALKGAAWPRCHGANTLGKQGIMVLVLVLVLGLKRHRRCPPATSTG